MTKYLRGLDKIFARLNRWPAIAMSILLVLLAVLWFDSFFHDRHFIFLPGGDVGLGFASHGGKLHWVEYAPWSPDPGTVYWSKAAVPYFFVVATVAAFLFLYLYLERKGHEQQRR